MIYFVAAFFALVLADLGASSLNRLRQTVIREAVARRRLTVETVAQRPVPADAIRSVPTTRSSTQLCLDC
jgi:hypothetical protein